MITAQIVYWYQTQKRGHVENLGMQPERNSLSPEELADIAERQAELAENFIEGIDPYLGGETHQGIRLRTHQPQPLRKLQAHFAETRDQVDRRILWTSPPNFGKSSLAALIVREARVGKPRPNGSRPLKAMTLVPRDVARTQVLESCKTFAPNVRAYGFLPGDGERAIDYNDMLVLTYQGMLALSDTQWDYMMSRTALLLPDEIHRGLGEKTSRRLLRAMDIYKPTTIALTATPDFNDDRTAAGILNITTVLPGMTAREATEAGVSNGVQLLAVKSGSVVRLNTTRPRDTDIAERDLAPLITDGDRNKLIVQIIADMARSGTHGIVQCLPGGGEANMHPVMIADAAQSIIIADPVTGKPRAIRAEAVGIHRRDNERVIANFKAGKVDVITFSKYLIEAFDTDMVRYIIAACPTTSRVDMGQLVGRGGRLGDPRLTRIFWLVDAFSASFARQLYTPFQVMGSNYQAEIIAPDPIRSSSSKALPVHPHPSQKPERTNPTLSRRTAGAPYADVSETLSPEVLEAMVDIPPGTVLDELLIIKSALHEVPSNYLRLRDLPTVRQGRVTPEGAAAILRNRIGADGHPLLVNVVDALHGVLTGYAAPEGVAEIEQRYSFSGKIDRLTITNFLEDQSWPKLSADGFIAACKNAEVEWAVQKKNMQVDIADAATLLHSLAEIPLGDPDEGVQLADLAFALEMSGSSHLLTYMGRNADRGYANAVLRRRSGRQPGAYKVVKFIKTAGAVMLAKDILRDNSERAAKIGKAAEVIIAEIQEEHRQYMQEHRLVAALSATAIDAFISSFAQEVLVEEIAPPPSPLLMERGIQLSSHGAKWRNHAACLGVDPEIFYSYAAATQQAALTICSGCGVKGDCLLDSLRTRAEGIVGNTTEDERRALYPKIPLIEQWLTQTKPNLA